MTGLHEITTVEAGIPMARGMRVVLFDHDAEIRAKVRTMIDRECGFVVAGESREWSGCEVLLDRFFPELLIASVTQVPVKFLENLSGTEFPVLVGLRGEGSGLRAHDGLYDTLEVPPEPEQVRGLLGRVRSEIHRRKADEFSCLLERYLACAATGKGQYISKLKVEDEEQTQEIAMEHVLLIAADGNYVRVHTDSRIYEIRDTMTGISARLDPSRFARLHRSFIVNLSHLCSVLTKDGPAVAKLSNGMEVPVGPHYRAEFESIIQRRAPLRA